MPVTATLDHVTIVTDDFEASRAVYDALLGCLGLAPMVDFEDPEADEDDTGAVAAVGYGSGDGRLVLWLVAGPAATTGAHLALAVTDPELVRAVHAVAADAGIPVVQPPRDWEADQLRYYGVQLADPGGNLIEVLVREPGSPRPPRP